MSNSKTSAVFKAPLGVWGMGLLYIVAGVNHFWHPDFYLRMLVCFLPYPSALNIVSGLAEIVLGIGILIPRTRKISAWGIIFLLVVIFPANINMAIHWKEWGSTIVPFLVRLPVQFLLIWWAYRYTKN